MNYRKDQPKECRSYWVNDPSHPKGGWWTAKCPGIKGTYEGYDKESYECKICGYSYSLYYDEMQ